VILQNRLHIITIFVCLMTENPYAIRLDMHVESQSCSVVQHRAGLTSKQLEVAVHSRDVRPRLFGVYVN